ncbi:uncharacterized protein H6S33_002164 [Morchella sextelata]|uniref:uncharacterized protein n=1 Tax=Morchella sextelata TaxID=1174677 RepID=UPI001D04679A|nr:uncharacterized protein H6S33_002164 [Morchella sextelata]KAH0608112.1 hypothetical protein H6S33_002164 [Morchella sextelata]
MLSTSGTRTYATAAKWDNPWQLGRLVSRAAAAAGTSRLPTIKRPADKFALTCLGVSKAGPSVRDIFLHRAMESGTLTLGPERAACGCEILETVKRSERRSAVGEKIFPSFSTLLEFGTFNYTDLEYPRERSKRGKAQKRLGTSDQSLVVLVSGRGCQRHSRSVTGNFGRYLEYLPLYYSEYSHAPPPSFSMSNASTQCVTLLCLEQSRQEWGKSKYETRERGDFFGSSPDERVHSDHRRKGWCFMLSLVP